MHGTGPEIGENLKNDNIPVYSSIPCGIVLGVLIRDIWDIKKRWKSC
jgi:hypothetical protein